MKIIDRVKAYIRQKEGPDPRSTGSPLDGPADPAPTQHDRARHEQDRDDKRLAVSTAHEAPEPDPATEPTTEPVTQPATEPITESATEPATEPTTESAMEPATEPATDLAIEPIAESTTAATEPATEPTTESTTEPTTAPAECPRCGATGEAPCTTPSGRPTKTHKGREQ